MTNSVYNYDNMTDPDDLVSDDLTKYTEYKTTMFLWKVITPILIVIGNIGNVLSIIILNRKSIRKSVCAVFLTILAMSDIFSLNTGLVRLWIRHEFYIDVRELSTFMCKIHTFLVYFALDLSAWMLVTITVERVGKVFFHIRFKLFSSKRNALLIVLLLILMVFGYNGHLLIGNGKAITFFNNETFVEICGFTSKEYDYFFTTYWSWLDFAFFCAVPSIILLTGNIFIVYKVRQSKRRLSATMSVQASVVRKHDSKITSMTAMIVTLNIVFLFSTAPISVYLIVGNTLYQYATPHNVVVNDLLYAIFSILMYTSNALNFALYVLSGRRFRMETANCFSSIYSRIMRQLQKCRRRAKKRWIIRDEHRVCSLNEPTYKIPATVSSDKNVIANQNVP